MKKPSENRKFNNQFSEYINLIIRMGIKKKHIS